MFSFVHDLYTKTWEDIIYFYDLYIAPNLDIIENACSFSLFVFYIEFVSEKLFLNNVLCRAGLITMFVFHISRLINAFFYLNKILKTIAGKLIKSKTKNIDSD